MRVSRQLADFVEIIEVLKDAGKSSNRNNDLCAIRKRLKKKVQRNSTAYDVMRLLHLQVIEIIEFIERTRD